MVMYFNVQQHFMHFLELKNDTWIEIFHIFMIFTTSLCYLREIKCKTVLHPLYREIRSLMMFALTIYYKCNY